MKNIKRFEIDVQTAFGGEDYDAELYPLKISDLGTDYASAADGLAVVELRVFGENEDVAAFQLALDDIDALFDVFNHIRGKVTIAHSQNVFEGLAENEKKKNEEKL